MKPKINNLPKTTVLNSDNFAPGDMFVNEGEVFLIMRFDTHNSDKQEVTCWDFQNNRTEIFVDEFQVYLVNEFSVSIGQRFESDCMDDLQDDSVSSPDVSSDDPSREDDEQLRFGDEDTAAPEGNTGTYLADVE